jgi:cyanophycin synthetase
VTVRDGIVMLCEGELEIPLVRLDRVPLTHRGRIAFQIENTLAAVGAAWSLGLARDAIRNGLESFTPDLQHVPGRFNLLDIGGVTAIVDYGHNPSSMIALTQAMDQFPHERRTAVYTCAGDRRDCDMVRQGELLGKAFDRVILYEDHYVRGRQEGEIMGLLKQGLSGATRTLEIQEIRGSVAAIEAALASVRPGELLMIQADTIDETVDYVRHYLDTHRNSREINLVEALNGRNGEHIRLDTSASPTKAATIAMATQSVE